MLPLFFFNVKDNRTGIQHNGSAACCQCLPHIVGDHQSRQIALETLDKIKDDSGLEEMWNRFKRVNYFVDDLTWGEVSETIVEEIPIVLEDFLLKNFNI